MLKDQKYREIIEKELVGMFKEVLEKDTYGFIEFFEECFYHSFDEGTYKSRDYLEDISIDTDVDFYGGATRLCMVPYSGNYVLKIQCDDEDYNGYEVSNYEAICEDYPAAKSFFPECWICEDRFEFADKKGHHSYSLMIMEKAELNPGEEGCDEFFKYARKGAELFGEEYQFGNVEHTQQEFEDWLDDMEYCYCDDRDRAFYAAAGFSGSKETGDLMVTVCDELHINDLHENNWGYLNGRLVIIDFSGF